MKEIKLKNPLDRRAVVSGWPGIEQPVDNILQLYEKYGDFRMADSFAWMLAGVVYMKSRAYAGKGASVMFLRHLGAARSSREALLRQTKKPGSMAGFSHVGY